MSTYVKHEPCSRCGSKDNFARYSDGGGYCFGCSYSERGQRTSSSHESAASVPKEKASDVGHHYSNKVIEWVSKYGITVPELIKHNVGWSPSREQLVYQFYGEGGELVLWQARNFRDGTTHKSRFFTSGSPDAVIARYVGSENKESTGAVGCLVEDCISAIKVSRHGVDGIPAFSAAISRSKLGRLSRLYSTLIVWLDSDKYTESKRLSTQAQMAGMSSRVIFTECDPKECSDEQIKELLSNI